MTAKDSDLEELRNLVHAEKTKSARLQTLIKKRTNSSISTPDPDPEPRSEIGPLGDRNKGKSMHGSSSGQGASPVHRNLTVEAAVHPRSSGTGSGSSVGRSGSNSARSASGSMSGRRKEAK